MNDPPRLQLPRLLVNADRTILVWLHPNGTYELATREHPDGIWGAPVELVDAEPGTRA